MTGSPTKARRSRKPAPKPFDKYDLYIRAVQAPDVDVLFIRRMYRELRGRSAVALREDFCGTFAISCEWAKLHRDHVAVGVDLDPEPIEYGKARYLAKLPEKARERVRVIQADVRDPKLPKVDVIAAMNFSHYIFKTREALLGYFRNCRRTLKPGGVLLVDAFGGSKCQEANEDKKKLRGFTYYWDQESFDPVTHNAVFHIHFRPDGGKKIERCFSYDWRMWTLPELREIMLDAGFKRTHVYWEGTDRKGEGDGVFKRVEVGEECQAWIAYVVGEA